MASVEIVFEDQKPIIDQLLNDIFENETISAGMTKAVPGVGDVKLNQWPLAKAFGAPTFISIIIMIGAGVSSRLIAEWILKKPKSKTTTKIKIGQTELKLDSNGSLHLIEKTIEIEKSE
jgi:hypothetical protein